MDDLFRYQKFLLHSIIQVCTNNWYVYWCRFIYRAVYTCVSTSYSDINDIHYNLYIIYDTLLPYTYVLYCEINCGSTYNIYIML